LQPFTEKNPSKLVVLVIDNFKCHLSTDFLGLCAGIGVKVVHLPPNTTHLLQPLDVGINGPLKTFLSNAWGDWSVAAFQQYKETHANGEGFQLPRPGNGDVIQWMLEGWEAVTAASFVNSFTKAGFRTSYADPRTPQLPIFVPEEADADDEISAFVDQGGDEADEPAPEMHEDEETFVDAWNTLINYH
jgi:hypothetical protein